MTLDVGGINGGGYCKGKGIVKRKKGMKQQQNKKCLIYSRVRDKLFMKSFT